jgi:hypothetical protein
MRAASISFGFLTITTLNVLVCYVVDKPPSPFLVVWVVVGLVAAGIITALE